MLYQKVSPDLAWTVNEDNIHFSTVFLKEGEPRYRQILTDSFYKHDIISVYSIPNEQFPFDSLIWIYPEGTYAQRHDIYKQHNKYLPHADSRKFAWDSKMNVYISEAATPKISVYNRHGHFVKQFGEKGKLDTTNIQFLSNDLLFIKETSKEGGDIKIDTSQFKKHNFYTEATVDSNQRDAVRRKIYDTIAILRFNSYYYWKIYVDEEQGLIYRMYYYQKGKKIHMQVYKDENLIADIPVDWRFKIISVENGIVSYYYSPIDQSQDKITIYKAQITR